MPLQHTTLSSLPLQQDTPREPRPSTCLPLEGCVILGTVFNHSVPQHSLLQNGGNVGSYLEVGPACPGSVRHTMYSIKDRVAICSVANVSSIQALRSRVRRSSESRTSSPYPPPGGARSPRATKKPVTQVANQDHRSRGRPCGGEGYPRPLPALPRPPPRGLSAVGLPRQLLLRAPASEPVCIVPGREPLVPVRGFGPDERREGELSSG